MSGPINGMNPNEVPYFNIEEYINKIKISDKVLSQANVIGEYFDNYIRFLSQYPDNVILYYLIDSFRSEMLFSKRMEHICDPEKVSNNNVFFDSLSMSHQRIKNLHSFVAPDDESHEYRNNEVNVSYFDNNGEQVIYWRGAKACDLKKFMDDYIKIYKEKGLSQLDSNPFLKSALISLIFLRIHPFGDGNGRTSRLLYDMKFTEMINKIYDTNLKISPVHLSMSIFQNRYKYAETINSIYFDLEHDSNDEINNWFTFLLNMTDEQLYYMSSDNAKIRIDKFNDMLARHNAGFEPKEKDIELMRIKKLK